MKEYFDNQDIDRMKETVRQTPITVFAEHYLTRDNRTLRHPAADPWKHGFICPSCGDGSGTGQGAGTFFNKNTNRMHCRRCGKSWDALALVAQCEHLDLKNEFMEVVNRAAAIVGLEGPVIEHKSAPHSGLATETRGMQKTYEEWVEILKSDPRAETARKYLENRGILVNTACSAGVGFDPNHTKLIFPTSETAFSSLLIMNNGTAGKAMNAAGKKIRPFHTQAIYEAVRRQEPVYVTEGWADALSILQSGGCALAMMGTPHIQPLLAALRDARNKVAGPFPPVVLALDNDNSGRKAMEKLRLQLKAYNFFNIVMEYGDGESGDPNDALKRNPTSLKKSVATASSRAMAEWEAWRTSYEKQKSDEPIDAGSMLLAMETWTQGDYLSGSVYKEDLEHFKKYANRKTGFENIDRNVGFYPGLYVLGAVPSLGKTTFALQLADLQAAKGEPVLFFSLEQSGLEIATKSLSRTMYELNSKEPLSAIQIRRGESNADLLEAQRYYIETTANNLTVAACSFNTTPEIILATIRAHADKVGVAPLVVIDYLQAISFPLQKLVMKDAVDQAVRMFKDIQRELDLTIILISSLNRSNYIMPVDYESFKESGGIEYTADVIWGLELGCMRESVFDDSRHVKMRRDIVNVAKKENPREVRFICLKNRYGIANYEALFLYNSEHDYFKALDGENFSYNANGWRRLLKQNSENRKKKDSTPCDEEIPAEFRASGKKREKY